LGENEVASLCESLRERKIPFFFYSGYGDLQSRFPNCVVVQKPASGETLLDAIVAIGSTAPPTLLDPLFGEAAPRTAARPFA
jgi:hypothetical protein